MTDLYRIGPEAMRRALIPTDYEKEEVFELFESAIERWPADEENISAKDKLQKVNPNTDSVGRKDLLLLAAHRVFEDATDLGQDVDISTEEMFQYKAVGESPFYNALAAILVKNNEIFEGVVEQGQTRKIRPYVDLSENFAYTITSIIDNIDASIEERTKIVAKTAGKMYEPPESQWGTTPEHTVVGVHELERESHTGKQIHLKIPMSAVSRKCLYFENEHEDWEDFDGVFRDNHLFIPYDAWKRDFYDEYAPQLFDYFVDLLEEFIGEEDIKTLSKYETLISGELEERQQNNQMDLLWLDYDPDRKKLLAIKRAIRSELPTDERQYFTAKKIVEACRVSS